ncbi:universal stress protein [Streptomyces sp. NPDC015661]|uniref:universal stress protein n=1 Tax=Streptomyces sp. NPDC015661 TaxID=3364961 RepID=UPI0036F8793F
MSDVLLGVDPHELSIPALIWAADAAARRGLPLRLVAAVPTGHDRIGYDPLARQGSVRIRAESALANLEDLVRELHGGLRTATELVIGPPATVLLARTARAAIAVVGSRHLGRAAGTPGRGSVVVPLAAHADCPVVVVRAPEHTALRPPDPRRRCGREQDLRGSRRLRGRGGEPPGGAAPCGVGQAPLVPRAR